MIRTLQLYVGRELLKTFALTAVGLTLTFSLCGGVLNMMQAEVLTAVQLARILGFVLPIATTLTLPVSALFACAIVYGRLSADNEFDACKASGINILRLLLPAFLLSVGTAAFTYTFTNHLIPHFIRQLDALVAKDLQRIVYQTLSTRGHIKFRDFVLYADQIQLFDQQEDVKSIRIRNAAFLELEQDALARCGTAHDAQIDFRRLQGHSEPEVEAMLLDVRLLDIRRSELFDTERQRVEPTQLPSRIQLKPKWLTLPELLKYRKRPLELPSIQDNMTKLQWLIWEARFFKYAHDALTSPDGKLKLADDNTRYVLTAENVHLNPDTFDLSLRKVTVEETTSEYKRRYTAQDGKIELSRAMFGTGEMYAQIHLRDKVVMIDQVDPSTRVEHPKRSLERVVLPKQWPGITDRVPTEKLLGDVTDPGKLNAELAPMDLSLRIDDVRIRQRREVVGLWQEIVGIIHSRLAFSVSNLVILVLAAGLGIILRGGQMLSAFVISFVPGMLVVVANIMGRQLTEKPDTYLLGLGIIWGGIVLLALAEIVILSKYLKR